MPKTWVAGEEIKAADLNKSSPESDARLNTLDHNVLELYLENYFAGKSTPYNGMIFDGFSDNSKSDQAATTLAAQAAAGQAVLRVKDGGSANFKAGQEIQIYDGVNREAKIIQSINVNANITTTAQNDNFNRVDSPTVGNGWTENDVDGLLDINGNQLRYRNTVNLERQAWIYKSYTKPNSTKIIITGKVTPKIENDKQELVVGIRSDGGAWNSGLGFRLDMFFGNVYINDNGASDASAAFGFLDNTQYNFELIINNDFSTELRVWLTTGSRPATPTLTSVAQTPTAAGSNVQIGGHNGSGVNALSFKVDDFQLDEVVDTDEITLTTNLANTYATGSSVKRTTATINTVTKKLQMGQIVGMSEDFESYTLGAGLPGLNGGTGWSGAWVNLVSGTNFVIDNIVTIGGTKNVKATDVNDGIEVYRDFPAKSSGSIKLKVRKETNGKLFDFRLREGATDRIVVRFDTDSNIKITNGAVLDTLQAFSLSILYTIEVKIVSLTKYKVSINGGAFSAEKDVGNNGFTSGATRFQMGTATGVGVGLIVYIDDIQGLEGDVVANDKFYAYYTKLNSFQQAMAAVKLWLVRNWTARFNPSAVVSAAATSLIISGDQTAKFAVGDTIDIYSSDNLKRERRTLTAVSFATPNTTLSWTDGLTNSYATADYVERVDALPKISIVDKGANESLAVMTYKKSIVDFTNSEVEDEYDYSPTAANEDVVVKVELSRNDILLLPYAKRLGCTLNT